MTSRRTDWQRAFPLAILAAAALVATPLRGAAPDPVDILLVSSTASTLDVVHAPMPDGLRRSLYKLDRAEGFWKRLRAGYERDPDSGAWRRTRSYDAATRTWSDPDVELGHEYCYRVVVRNAADEQAQGAMACGVFNGGDASVRPPAPATNVAILRSEPNLHVLGFTDAADNEQEFAIERRAETGLDWVTVQTLPASDGSGTTLEFADDGVDMEQRYCYRVRAIGEHGNALSGGACERTPALAAIPSERPGRTRPFVIRRPEPNRLTISWSDRPSMKEWSVLLYDPDDLDKPNDSRRVRDRRDPPRRLRGATFDNLIANRLYCIRVVQRGLKAGDHPVLCESPHARRRSNSHVGPAADSVPRASSLRPLADGLVLILATPRQGQLVDIVTEHGRRFTHLGARDGSNTVRLSGLEPETGHCVRPWVFNTYGSRYGEPLCATTAPAQSEPPPGDSITYSTGMDPNIQSAGVIPYIHVVEPGPPRPVKLVRVRVIGSGSPNYHVRFVRPQSGTFSCSQEDGDGVTIVPGNELSGPALATLFGSETPEIPQTGLTLIGCKLLVGGMLGNTNRIPIDVTYRRP